VTTREVIRWHFSPLDCLQLAGIALAGFALVVLELAASRLERVIDDAGER
jgi:hypothetical protein